MRRLIQSLLILSIFFIIQRFCHRETEGFTPPKIQSNLQFNPDWEVQALDSQSEMEVRALLAQPFFYLGRGAQVYAFVSADGSTVIKFFRHHRMRTLLCHLTFLLPQGLKNRLDQTIEKRRAKLHKDFHSYKLAYQQLKQETALLYLHLNKTQNLQLKCTLYDKIGVRHIIDLDQTEFILQKRAELFYPTLTKWIQQKSFDPIKISLSELIALLKIRCQKGLFDKDPNLCTNFGFLGSHPIQFDIGRFKEDSTYADPLVYTHEINRIIAPLIEWLEEKAPALAEYMSSEVSTLSQSLK